MYDELSDEGAGPIQLDLSKVKPGQDLSYKYSDRYDPKAASVAEFLAKPNAEMTKADAIVKKRLNPHMIEADDFLGVDITDPSLNDMLAKQGGIPVNPSRAVYNYNSKYETREKPVADMDEDEKETYYMARRLRRDNKPDVLYARLQQFIRLDSEQQRVEKFGQEMYKEFIKQLTWRESGDERFSLGQALKMEASLVSQIGDAKQQELGLNL